MIRWWTNAKKRPCPAPRKLRKQSLSLRCSSIASPLISSLLSPISVRRPGRTSPQHWSRYRLSRAPSRRRRSTANSSADLASIAARRRSGARSSSAASRLASWARPTDAAGAIVVRGPVGGPRTGSRSSASATQTEPSRASFVCFTRTGRRRPGVPRAPQAPRAPRNRQEARGFLSCRRDVHCRGARVEIVGGLARRVKSRAGILGVAAWRKVTLSRKKTSGAGAHV